MRSLLPLLACGVPMAIAMLIMSRGSREKTAAGRDRNPGSSAQEAAVLREEVAKLRSELSSVSERREDELPTPQQ